MFELAEKIKLSPEYRRIFIDDDIADMAYKVTDLSPATLPNHKTYFEFRLGASNRSDRKKIGCLCASVQIDPRDQSKLKHCYIVQMALSDDSFQTVLRYPFFAAITPGINSYAESKILFEKRGFAPVKWPLTPVWKWVTFNLCEYVEGKWARDVKMFMSGKEFITNLKYKDDILSYVASLYSNCQIIAGVLTLMANNVIEREVIPSTPIPNIARMPIVGDCERLVKIKVTPHVVLIPSKSTGTGTKQKWHIRRGSERIKGNCINQIADRLNLCDRKNTSDPNKAYCGICKKRCTKVEAYEAGDEKLGRITKVYRITR